MSTSGVLVRAAAAGFVTDGDQMGSKTHQTVAARSICLYWDIGLSIVWKGLCMIQNALASPIQERKWQKKHILPLRLTHTVKKGDRTVFARIN